LPKMYAPLGFCGGFFLSHYTLPRYCSKLNHNSHVKRGFFSTLIPTPLRKDNSNKQPVEIPSIFAHGMFSIPAWKLGGHFSYTKGLLLLDSSGPHHRSLELTSESCKCLRWKHTKIRSRNFSELSCPANLLTFGRMAFFKFTKLT